MKVDLPHKLMDYTSSVWEVTHVRAVSITEKAAVSRGIKVFLFEDAVNPNIDDPYFLITSRKKIKTVMNRDCIILTDGQRFARVVVNIPKDTLSILEDAIAPPLPVISEGIDAIFG